MIKLFVAVALAAIVPAAPAAAVTYDAFASFDGTQGAGGFSYGTFDGDHGFTPFTVNTNCFVDASTCLQSAANHDVPGATKSLATSFQYGSVNVPDDMLLVHLGEADGQAVYIMFTAPVTGLYSINGGFKVLDVHPTGVDLLVFVKIGSLFVAAPSGNLATSGETQPFFGDLGLLYAGDSFGFIVDKAGNYGSDSTGINFTVVGSAVPEAASWAMLIAGLGLTGAAMRRRRPVSIAA